MLKLKRTRMFRAIALAVIAGTPMVLASVPRSNEIANDTAIYQDLHEIKITRLSPSEIDNTIDHDVKSLSAIEKSHRKPVHMRVSAPMDRIEKMEYRPSVKKQSSKKLRHKR